MRTFETKIQELKTAVLTEVARLTWEDRLQTGTAILDIPEKIIPGPTATLRCCIYKERAIINSRVKLAMGVSGDRDHRGALLPGMLGHAVRPCLPQGCHHYCESPGLHRP